MSAVLEKRTYDERVFDINCSSLLDEAETISTIVGFVDEGGSSANTFTYSSGVVNSSPITYPDGSTAAVGKVIQVKISGGVIPTGMTKAYVTVRARFISSSGDKIEGTVMVKLTDSLSS